LVEGLRMFIRWYVGFALAWSAVFLAGCGNGAATERSPPPGEAAAPQKRPPGKSDVPPRAGVQVVTLHVKGMVERLKLV
jgi:hypothetical protein